MPHGRLLFDFDAVLFDVDGTLVDSLEMIVRGLGDTFERFAGVRPPPETILRQIGKPLTDQVGLFLSYEPTDEQVLEMSAYAIERFTVHEELERLFQPAVDCLRLLHRQGVRTALVTSKSTVELNAFLTRFEGAPYVDATVCASDVHQPKPHPESALRACEILGVRPERAAMIGDSIYDLRCARQAGLTAVAVAYGAGLRYELLNEQPDLLIETPEALLAWTETAFLQTPCRERS
ncbi:HAD family hydrolase [Fimbriimonas ginsengisoli]|uniref:HAD family hydrolase n=1 Tax=Fimbriimonas ginsengisoli Gsoil 348 TaxID=661478 RepID=A0A068NUI7_FIMGI|nr:HAD family hydrolase [Fimbriimonas ginsengisoli]AIE87081.1 HAD family hydrolase [Fimbriimonas ginsengisoli Gsoil 348]